MAIEDEETLRKRRREREDEAERLEEEKREKLAEAIETPDPTRILELMDRIEPLLEQVNMLYLQYVRGTEKRPPLERRKQLDQIMNTITLMGKPTQAIQFRYNSIHSTYVSYRDKWERMLKDLENGKVTRISYK